MKKIKLIHNALSVELYQRFHTLVGFRDYVAQDVAQALAHSVYSVVAYEEDEPIGIARIVGDGRIVFFIKDVIVHPKHQGKGYGALLMQDVLNFTRGAGCPGAYVGLMATCGTEPFYEKLSFQQRPNDQHGAGMILFLDEERC